MIIQIRDIDEDRIYALELSVEDAIKLLNMQLMRQPNIKLPSIGGNATLTPDDTIGICYQNGSSQYHGSIFADFDTLTTTISNQLKDNN